MHWDSYFHPMGTSTCLVLHPQVLHCWTYYFDDVLQALSTAAGRGSVDLSEPALPHRPPQGPAVFASHVGQDLPRGQGWRHLVRPTLLGPGSWSRAYSLALRLVLRVCGFHLLAGGFAFGWHRFFPLSDLRTLACLCYAHAHNITDARIFSIYKYFEREKAKTSTECHMQKLFETPKVRCQRDLRESNACLEARISELETF